MTDPGRRTAHGSLPLASEVDASARRKIKARRLGPPVVWSGLAMMGAVGWSVAVPTLLGAALGTWVDHLHPGVHSWTLALLMAGLVVGCFSAWHWISGEEKAMRDEQADGDD